VNQSRKRIVVGIISLTIGFFGLIVSVVSFVPWGPMWPGMAYPMMRNMMPIIGHGNQGALTEVNGTVEEVGRMEIELEADGKEIEVHGPSWFWQKIGIREGDVVTVKGVFISMMDMGKSWHEELLPFELTVNGKTYGNASSRIPIWMQE